MCGAPGRASRTKPKTMVPLIYGTADRMAICMCKGTPTLITKAAGPRVTLSRRGTGREMIVRRIIAISAGVVVIAAVVTIGYGLILRRSAERLVRSAMEVRSSADVEHTTERWRRQYGHKFTERGSHGDRTYDVVLTNEPLFQLHLVPFVYLLASITTTDYQLRAVTVSMYVEPRGKAQKLILVQEDFSQPTTAVFRVQPLPYNQIGTVRRAKVYLSAGVSESQRLDAFSVNTSCLTRFSGCDTPQQMLPAVKELAAPSS
jgi:hypothetical protein